MVTNSRWVGRQHGAPVGSATTATPANPAPMAIIWPEVVHGCMSPYPTVVIVICTQNTAHFGSAQDSRSTSESPPRKGGGEVRSC